MKSRSFPKIAAALFLLAPLSLPAAVEFWDPNGAVAGVSVSGNWDTTTSNWTSVVDSGVSNAWIQTDDAVFGLGGNYTVTLTTPITVGNLTATGTAGGLTIAGTVVNNLNIALISTFNVTNATRTNSVSAPIVGPGALTKTGNGVLVLSGANTYLGDTTLSGGAIGIGSDSASSGGLITSGPLGTGNFIFSAAATVFASGAAHVVHNPVTLNGGLTNTGSLNLTFTNGNFTLSGANRNVTVNNTADLIIGSNLADDTVARTLTKAGAGRLILSGTNSGFLGPITVGAGILRIASDNALQANAVVTANGTLDLNGYNGKVVGLAGSGSVTLGSATLTIANAGSSRNFTGVISGIGSVIVSNTISQQLEGQSTFSGGLFIQAGTLFLRTNIALGDPIIKAAGAGPITMIGSPPDSVVANITAALGGNATTGLVIITNRVILSSGRVLLFPSNGGAVQYDGNISGAGGIVRSDSGSGPAVLTGSNTFSGGVQIESRVLGLGHKNALGSGPFSIGSPVTFPANAIILVPVADLSGANALTNVTTINQSFNVLATNNFELSGPMTISNSPTITILGNNPVKFSGIIDGPAGFTKAGTNKLVLSGANSYGGVTIVTGGALLVNNTTGSGTSTNPVTVFADATLGGSGTVASAVTINGGGTIAPGNSAGLLTLTNGLDLSSGGTNAWELTAPKDNSSGIAGIDFDQISLTGGNLLLGGPSTLLLQFPGSPAAPTFGNPFWQSNHTWKVIALSGAAANPGNLNFGSIAGTNGVVAGTFSTSVDGGGNVFLSFSPAPFPPRPVIDGNISGAGTTNATISWSAAVGVAYEVQYKNDLSEAVWSVLGSVTATGSTASIVDPTSPPAVARFYRVVIQ